MAAIIIPRRHYTQPQGRVAVDWGNPFTRGLVYVNTTALHNTNAVSNVSNGAPGDKIATIDGVGAGWAGEASTESAVLAHTDFTFLTAFRSRVWGTDPATRAVLGRGPTSGSNNTGFGLHARHATAGYAGAVYCGSSYSIIGKPTGAPLVDNTTYMIGAAVSGGAGAVYSNGIKTASVASGLSARDVTGRLSLGANSFNADLPTTAPLFAYYYQWSRALSDSEIAELSSNPWQIFRADPHRIYSLPPVITIPTLSSPGVTDITATSARPQVTLTY